MKQNFNQKSRTVPDAQIDALRVAIFDGDKNTIMAILENHPHVVNEPDGTYIEATPLHSAILAKRADIAALLLQHGADPNQRSLSLSQPLTLAVGQTKIAELLLNAGADIEGRVGKYVAEKTPLLQAVWKLNVETVQLLVNRGANVNASYRGQSLADLIRQDIDSLAGNHTALIAAHKIQSIIQQKIDLQNSIFKRAKLQVR